MPLTDALAFYARLAEEYGVTAVVITQDFCYYTVGSGTVLNRKEYADYIGSSLTVENLYTFAEISSASDTVVRSEQEEAYIAYIAGLH